MFTFVWFRPHSAIGKEFEHSTRKQKAITKIIDDGTSFLATCIIALEVSYLHDQYFLYTDHNKGSLVCGAPDREAPGSRFFSICLFSA